MPIRTSLCLYYQRKKERNKKKHLTFGTANGCGRDNNNAAYFRGCVDDCDDFDGVDGVDGVAIRDGVYVAVQDLGDG